MNYPPWLLDQIRSRVPISQIVGRHVTWDKRKSSPGRKDFWANCPFHGEKTPSFHCEDGKGRYHCFGCGAAGDHFSFLMEREGLSFKDAVREVAQIAGVELPDNRPPVSPEEQAERDRRAAAAQAEYEERQREAAIQKALEQEDSRAGAYAVWKRRVPLLGTVGEKYLRARGYDGDLAAYPALGFIDQLAYPKRYGGGFYPSVVAAVTGPDGRFRGIWRIYLQQDGSDKASVEAPKLGQGPCAGGAVWLGKPAAKSNTCEGIETGLSVRSMVRWQTPVAACLSTSGLKLFEPPEIVRTVLNWPDGDTDRIKVKDGQERFEESPGMKASREHVEAMRARGLRADAQFAVKNGDDFNDVFRAARELRQAAEQGETNRV